MSRMFRQALAFNQDRSERDVGQTNAMDSTFQVRFSLFRTENLPIIFFGTVTSHHACISLFLNCLYLVRARRHFLRTCVIGGISYCPRRWIQPPGD